MTHTSLWLSSGWRVVKDDLPAFIGLTFLAGVFAAMAHALNAVVFLILAGPALAAIYAVLLAHLRTGRIELKHVNDVGPVFLSAMLTGILVILFATLGFWLFIIPAIIVLALYLFPFFLILERNLSFWDAMEESRRKVQEDLLGFVGFVAALLGINLLGAICFGFGLLVSIPVTLCAVAIAYRELWPDHVEPAQEQG